MIIDEIEAEILRLQIKRAKMREKSLWEAGRSLYRLNRRSPLNAIKVWFLGFAFTVTLFALSRGGSF